jgi:tetratricopeptide (TPR) repeat protein
MNPATYIALEAPLPSLRDFLSDESIAARNPTQWLAQAELFLRWGLDPREKRHDAFWKFVELISAGRDSESVFPECFGLSLAETDKDLARYATVAKRSSIRWPRDNSPERAIEVREASRNEIARIRGEWERLETRYVRKKLPSEESAYLAQARRTVGGAYARGDRDPGLVATFGLLQLEAGDVAAAERLLEEATASSVNRPRAYFELAKIRFEQALDRTHRNDGKIEGPEVTGVVDLLASATTKAPPLLGVYELLADAWTNAAIEPDETQLAVIRQGLTYFVSEPVLHYRAAGLYRKLGDYSQADRLAEQALKFAAPQQATEIREFREQLAAAKKE